MANARGGDNRIAEGDDVREGKRKAVRMNGFVDGAWIWLHRNEKKRQAIYFFFSLMKRRERLSKKTAKIYSLLCLDTKKQKSSDYIIC